ncbi:hypothetical protein TBR22_A46380 [Luteitalea sp. TBR-22]|nr:hypothetical protein TBR22_A46380 [Luteitalea sp. TBR-22]
MGAIVMRLASISRLALIALLASAAASLPTVLSTAPLSAQAPAAQALDPFGGFHWRHIGPHRGGRVTAVAGHRRQPGTFYMGATGGGVWKSTDYGQSWNNVSDGFFETASIGAIEVAESNPDVIYVGTGSAAIRSNVIKGLGVYKSTDAGKTWTHVGLRDVGAIGAVRVHPSNPDVVYVAAVGPVFVDGPQRGVFRSKDGGKTWEKVLFINDRTGVFSLVFDPSNPDRMYAAAWRGQRKPWTIISGGPAAENGIYTSTDAGSTWTRTSQGLPTDLLGKIDIDVSRANPRRLYAIVEAVGDKAGLYRSDDAGATWAQVNKDSRLIARPFYYTYVDADPKNADVVWVNNLSMWKSTDGGATFSSVATPHGDNHGMWINPDDADLFIQSNDGGANVSRDGGRTWTTQFNQPTAEIYQVDVDHQYPYRVYGAQQDNTTVIVPSNAPLSTPPDDTLQWWMQGAGCETGPIKPKPDDPRIVYGVCKGEFSRLNLATGQEQHYWVYPQNRYGHASRDIRYRFQRTSPFEISPHDPKVIYHTSQVVHRTRDEGKTWEVISPDLTANLPEGQGISGEPITRDITGEEVYATIYAFEESPLEKGVLWSGANDGPVHVSRDDGRTWNDVTPKDLPPGGRVQQIDPSPHRKGSAYIAYYRYLLGDWAPYVYRTDDYGRSWTRLTDGRNGIPADTPVRVVREDPDRAGLLYAGTEFGMYLSWDNGATWQRWQLDLPVTPITDMRLHRKDLVISTMGRGFWVLDDVSRLHQWKGAPSSPTLFAPREATRARLATSPATSKTPDYPGAVATIDYALPADAQAVSIDILDAKGGVLRTYASEGPGTSTTPTQAMRAPGRRTLGAPRVGRTKGTHRFTWDMRLPGLPSAGNPEGGAFGPMVVPGTYAVRLTVDGVVAGTQPLKVRLDPRVVADGVTQADLQAQAELLAGVRDATRRAVEIAGRLGEVARGADAGRAGAAAALRAKLVTAGGNYPQPMLIDQLANVWRMANQADQRPGRDAVQRLDDLRADLAAIEKQAEGLR